MIQSINSKLYNRFNLELNLEKVQHGFCKHMRTLMTEELAPFVNPDFYEDPNELYVAREKVLKEACRQMLQDYESFNDHYSGFKNFLRSIFEDFGMLNRSESFEEYLLHFQIFLNILHKNKIIHYELFSLAEKVAQYLEDFQVLGLKLKIYKTKAPQIVPSISKFFDRDIENTLGILEPEKYSDVLKYFEEGLKEFLMAKGKGDLKDVVEDMCTTCDELVKVVSGDKNKGFKHVFSKDEYKKFGFTSKSSKEIYRNLRDWMDTIKHGTLKNFSKEDVEMIITLSAAFIRFVVNNNSFKIPKNRSFGSHNSPPSPLLCSPKLKNQIPITVKK